MTPTEPPPHATDAPPAPWKPLHLAPPAVETRPLAGGGLLLRSRHPLGPYARSLGELLRQQAAAVPERTFLAERTDGGGGGAGGGWRRLSYGACLQAVERIAGALLARGLTARRPVALLSDNGIDHALLQLAAMHVGIPAAPISPAYSLLSRDHLKLRAILRQVRPGLVFAADGEAFAAALAAAFPRHDVELVVSARPPAGRTATLLADLLAQPAGADVAARAAAVGPDTVAKILFTSGSTGSPKGVLNTQRMLCSNQQAIATGWRFLADRPPVLVDWLPWSHTFGGNHNFNLVLRHGGTLYIDAGKPAPGAFETTVANLREVPSTLHFNVPRGFEMLVPRLADDRDLRDTFFRDLDVLFYAAAALPQHLWKQLEQLSVAATGRRVVMLAAWGSTETAPCATQVHMPIERAGVIGVPVAGTDIKLVPAGDKLEIRVKGPNVTPGYWPPGGGDSDSDGDGDNGRGGTGEATGTGSTGGAGPFDEDGFLATGDAARLADPSDPARGLIFDGRLAENFKLSTGTWVQVGELRADVLAAAAPLIQEAVVTGHDRAGIGLLLFPNLAACRALCGDTAAQLPTADLLARAEVRAGVAAALAAHNAANPGASRRLTRALLLAEPPSIDAGEITDKGYVNQRAVLANRAALVERLHRPGPDPEAIDPQAPA
jgi:feruloyl-CoA synthase